MQKIALALMFLAASCGLAQTPAKTPDTLQALLVEVHQLRQDIESMTVASQRVQIALYSLQMQDAAVGRATLRMDEVRNKCSAAEVNRERMASDVQRTESMIASGALKEAEAKELQLAVTQRKHEIEAIAAEAQTCQAAEAQASTQFRNEQAKLAEIQDRIARLDKALEKLGADPR